MGADENSLLRFFKSETSGLTANKLGLGRCYSVYWISNGAIFLNKLYIKVSKSKKLL